MDEQTCLEYEDTEAYSLFCKKMKNPPRNERQVKCLHADVIDEGNGLVCSDCGYEQEKISFDPEWRMYNSGDSQKQRDTSRSHQIKTLNRSIKSVLQQIVGVNITERMHMETYRKFMTVVGSETSRGRNRNAIIAACLLYVYREQGDFRTSEEIRLMFGLEKGDMSDGLTRYYEKFPEDATKHIKPKQLVRSILIKTGINEEKHYQNVYKMCEYLENSSKILNGSGPQSVAAAVTYVYINQLPRLRKKHGFTKTTFAKLNGLSDITITKLSKEVQSLLDTIIKKSKAKSNKKRNEASNESSG